MADKRHGKKPHAIMISVPFPGHINPYVNLALKLASNSFAITFVHLEFVHHMLSKSNKTEVDLFSEARGSGFDIQYATISDGFPLEFDRVLHFDEYRESSLRKFPAIVDEFIEKTINSDPFSVPFLVTDTVYSWSVPIAKKYNLVSVSFWTEPALVFSLIYHLDLLKEHHHFPCKDNIEEEVTYLPGVKSINTRDIMPYLKEAESKGIDIKMLSEAFAQVKKADFILHNTVHELESDTLSALNKHQPNYAIGPINFISKILTKPTWLSESDCTHWLKNKPQNSVLYVSFGSLVQISKQIIEEIAYGLLLSEVSFIWAVRSSSILPVGFEEEIKDKGLIVPWCDQMMVLSNPAVGVFLTHCGWNSIIESIWCGVPMICYPVTYDQPVNRKLVVDDWKIGINLISDDDGELLVNREKVAEKIKSFMLHHGNNNSKKAEMEKVRAIMQNAMEVNDGSSKKNFDQFIKDLKAKIYVNAINT